jgi:hypothetical protein
VRGEVKSTIYCGSSALRPFTQVIMERKTGTNSDGFPLGPNINQTLHIHESALARYRKKEAFDRHGDNDLR